MKNPYKKGTDRAKELRGKWDIGNGPIRDLFLLLEDHGIESVRWEMESKISGCLTEIPELGPLIFINIDRNMGHQVFTAAHELYHHLFEETRPFRFENLSDNNEKSPSEKSADAFAAEFLVPPSGLMSVLKDMDLMNVSLSLENVIRVQMRFGVSFRMLVYRLGDLGFISDRERNTLLNKNPGQKAFEMGFTKEDVFGPDGPIFPRRFRRLAVSALVNAQISRGKFMELLHLTRDEFHELVRELGIEDELAPKEVHPL